MSETARSERAIDWRLATRRSATLTRPGPHVEPAERAEFIAELRTSAQDAPAHVGAVTGLLEPALRAGTGPVYVIDRPRWAEANIEMLRGTIGDVLPAPSRPWGGRFAGEELGAILALLASRVLGQYDPFTTRATENPGPAAQSGRLVLVAPNIWHIQNELGVNRRDFGMWVCLHEQTHALQFAAAPWLTDHLRMTMRTLMTAVTDTDSGAQRLENLLRALPDVLTGRRNGAPAGALVDAVLNEPERAAMAETVALMSLLEGHADVVMDAVGPRVVPTVKKIRKAFEKRRAGTGPIDLLLRRILGLDAKLAQYRNGAAFVRTVVDQVGHEGFNAVWSGPEALPSADEIADPAAWVRRLHG
ncbi:zinc-dependent metalloprotease [Ruania halotolerans]|uniref:zinc-dependent metalloprotease n=1 Tax=Ruania halotolerans TaxID=2897773 RepID=UPI001E50D82B|nr:zinc-dependent metalloprotease [Ruania halotolerans]UFU07167.1 zinc-dependent metalloprotease [Ruania halotolerans]